MNGDFSSGDVFVAVFIVYLLYIIPAGIHYIWGFNRRQFLQAVRVTADPQAPGVSIDATVPAVVKVDRGVRSSHVTVAFNLAGVDPTPGQAVTVSFGSIRERYPDLWRLSCFYSYLAEWSSIFGLYFAGVVLLMTLITLADGVAPVKGLLIAGSIAMTAIGCTSFLSRRHCRYIAKKHGLAGDPDLEF